MSEWITRDEALRALGVKPQTLYAYASRGRIGVKPDPDDPRRSFYRTEDVRALTTRRARGRRSSAIAASAIAWGEPAIATGISTVRHGQLIYRGHDAAMLARTATLEEVAALLWEQPETPIFSAAERGSDDPFLAIAGLVAGSRPSMGRLAAKRRADAALAVGTLAGAVGAEPGDTPVHARLARGWRLDGEASVLIRRALVLLADHELNASTFAARVAASTGASIAASLLAGLGALSGPRHGGVARAVTALVDEAARLGAAPAISTWLARGHPLPGFGHPLYPDGDPRAVALLEGVAIDPLMTSLRDAAAEITGEPANIDYALAVLSRALDLPRDAAFKLFALGRSVGWSAHAMEQAASEQLIRPRAHYVGAIDA